MIDPLELPLRDIHLPAPVPWWPIAPAWWLVLGGILVVITTGALSWRWWRRGRLRRAARQQLLDIETAFVSHQDTHRLARELSVLCRQILSRISDGTAVSTTGEAWLSRLDEYSTENFFTAGAGRVLASAAYDPKVVIDDKTLLLGMTTWISRLPPLNPPRQYHV